GVAELPDRGRLPFDPLPDREVAAIVALVLHLERGLPRYDGRLADVRRCGETATACPVALIQRAEARERLHAGLAARLGLAAERAAIAVAGVAVVTLLAGAGEPVAARTTEAQDRERTGDASHLLRAAREDHLPVGLPDEVEGEVVLGADIHLG